MHSLVFQSGVMPPHSERALISRSYLGNRVLTSAQKEVSFWYERRASRCKTTRRMPPGTAAIPAAHVSAGGTPALPGGAVARSLPVSMGADSKL